MKTAIKCGKLFDPNTKSVLENMLIVIEGDKVLEVLPAQNAETAEMNVIDLSDKFVMPGLIDGHVHIGMSGQGGNTADGVRRLLGEDTLTSLKNAQTDLYAGFTTLRDCGANGFNDVAVRNSINKGEFIGPRLVVCGESMGSTGGHSDSHYAPQLIEATPKHHIIDGVASAYHAARYNIKYGADFLKFMSTGGVMSFGTTVGAQQLTFEEMRAIIEIAEMYGVHTATHAHGTNGIKCAVRAGVTSVEHGMILDDEAIELMLEHGTYLTPTIIAAERIVSNGETGGMAPWMVDKARQVLSRHENGFRKCLERGVKIAFGTDAGTPYNFHGKQGYEFELMNKFGMKIEDILVAATKTNSQLLRKDKEIGTLETGKYADVVAFEKNPMEDVTTMKNCVFVMKGGAVIKG